MPRKTYKWIVGILLSIFAILMGGLVVSCNQPKYIATMGADVYHSPDCEYAKKSLAKYGQAKRKAYYSRSNKALLGRKPCPKCNPK